MKKRLYILLFLPIVLTSQISAIAGVSAQKGININSIRLSDLPGMDAGLLAFPTAKGFARYTEGGSGGDVIKATNMGDTGAGSLRQALIDANSSGQPSTIVFDVGGEIPLASILDLIGDQNADLTIAGETAPSPGVSIKNFPFEIYEGNIILRYMTSRIGSQQTGIGPEYKSIRLRANTGSPVGDMENIIIDHFSGSWVTDEGYSIDGNPTNAARNITIQNSIFSEPLGGSGYTHLFGSETYNVTQINNYHAHAKSRNYLYGFGVADENVETINNIWYHVNGGANVAHGNHVDLLGNIWKEKTSDPSNFRAIEYNANATNNPGQPAASDELYYADNIFIGFGTNGTIGSGASTWNRASRVPQNSGSFVDSWLTSQSEIEDLVLNDVGNNIYQDAVDARVIQDYYDDDGIYLDPETETDVGGYPTKNTVTRAVGYDTDDDGMPDTWEVAQGLDPNVADNNGKKRYFSIDGLTIDNYDHNNIIPGSGTAETDHLYTNLRIYLFDVAKDFEKLTQ